MSKEIVLIAALLLVLSVCSAVRFGQLCSGNTDNHRRTNDSFGSGHYGDIRVHGLHKGVDVVCDDGSTVYVPFNVTLKGRVTVFTDPNKTAINNSINLEGEGLCFKLFPIDPDKTSGTLCKGERIGTMLPMQTVFPVIISHVHVQMCDNADPTSYF
ncbi:leukocyte cell-derived chemotaxin-2-like [Thalassophryne amazonica]|uniref:leukocyte cell-derived chemotaxin-2-like n=1 Tax=Thalassophryne amazonica TaxID=390379 RepID=UPI0014726A24|nr:leukocyte cell-derived chemotaxin-2-like [Thalassophryne amazonica]